MCRIAGFFNASTSLPVQQAIDVMTDAMQHGGPDGRGTYLHPTLPFAMGHRRLALVDLTEQGSQPMYTPDKRYVISFNGEIYNYQELKQQLIAKGYSFTNRTDTEVILQAYACWGIHCFEKFNGMFALALFDTVANELILARDHVGMKPLYYSLQNQQLYFASEIRAFTALVPNWPENEQWRTSFLMYGHLPEPNTTLQQVYTLEKGTAISISLPALTVRTTKFYAPQYSAIYTQPAEAKEAIVDSLTQALQRHLLADAPVGLFLSGGVDSSILTLLAAPILKQKLVTLSIDFEEQAFSEYKYQQAIIEKTKAKHTRYKVTKQEFYESLPDILKAMDQPSTDGINSYFICKYARHCGLTAVLSGVGADELFGGYQSFHRTQKVAQLKKIPAPLWHFAKLHPQERFKRLAVLTNRTTAADYLLYRGIYTPAQVAKVLDITEKEVWQSANEISFSNAHTKADTGNYISQLETELYMKNQLLKDTDYMSMWHSVEVRMPFLDKQVIQVAHGISDAIKYNPRQPKHLLVKAFETQLPAIIWQRKKQGFVFPFENWLKNIGATYRTPFFWHQRTLFLQNKLHWSKYWACVLAQKGRDTKLITNFDSQNSIKPKLAFHTLTTYSKVGGIEKYNSNLFYALQQLEQNEQLVVDGFSVHDTNKVYNNTFSGTKNWTGFSGIKSYYSVQALLHSSRYSTHIVGHINLSAVGCFMKWKNSSQKIVLVVHGIEVWKKLYFFQRWFVHIVDEIWAVSNFTKQQLLIHNPTLADKIKIFPNTISADFTYPKQFVKPPHLLEKYQLTTQQKVLYTLSRLSNTEKYKGYDLVLQALQYLVYTKKRTDIVYLIGGKGDADELTRVKNMIVELQLTQYVKMIGFVADEELTNHYLLADCFVMPSKKEGFGIVFIEAMACGVPVVAGNKDGSVDALKNGELGTLVNPDDYLEVAAAVEKVLEENNEKLHLQQNVKNSFGFEEFTTGLKKLLK